MKLFAEANWAAELRMNQYKDPDSWIFMKDPSQLLLQISGPKFLINLDPFRLNQYWINCLWPSQVLGSDIQPLGSPGL